MTKKRFLKLTAIAASVMLTVAALAVYRGGFAQQATGRQQKENPADSTQAIDSVALAKGLAELQRIIGHYNNQRLMVNGEIRYYNADSSATSPAEKASFVFALDDEKSLYELDSVITVTAEDVALVVDKRDESIAVVERNALQAESPEAMQPSPDMLSTMKDFIKDIRITQQGQQSLLTIHFTEEAPFNIMEYVIAYDAQSYAIKKIRMSMTDAELENGLPDEDQAGVTEDDELYFVDSSNNAIPTGIYAKANLAVYEIIYGQERSLQPGAISISQYVRQDGEGYTPVGKYKNYSILN